MSDRVKRQKKSLPNILITGTPGVGKSRLCEAIAEKFEFKHQDVSQIAKEHGFIESHDDALDCDVLDEDKVMDFMEMTMSKGGNVVEYHACEMFPERWFDLVFVVTCDNTILYDRLLERQYNEKKLASNIECEIFHVILEEAQSNYEPEIVHRLSGDTMTDFEKNMTLIEELINKLST